jgi:hypothetical protein
MAAFSDGNPLDAYDQLALDAIHEFIEFLAVTDCDLLV